MEEEENDLLNLEYIFSTFSGLQQDEIAHSPGLVFHFTSL